MKKTLLTLLLVSVSSSTLANGFYVGAAYSQLGHGKVSYSEQVSSDNGFAASAGYDLDLGSVFTLAAELEYKDLGGVVEREPLGMGSYAQVDRIIEESAVELGFGGGLGYHFGPLTAQLSMRIKKYC